MSGHQFVTNIGREPYRVLAHGQAEAGLSPRPSPLTAVCGLRLFGH